MTTLQSLRARLSGAFGAALVATLSALMAAPAGAVPTQDAQAAAPATEAPESAKLTPDQLDSLVAPIALYPDPLLAQCLVAATYPIDVVAAQQWMAKNSTLKGDALVKAAEQQPWDPSVQALVTLPDAAQSPVREHQVDAGSRRRVPGVAGRRHGRGPAPAREGQGRRQARDHRAAEGRNDDRGVEDRHRDPAHVDGGRLRSELQPDRDLGTAGLPLSSDVLPALLSRRRAHRLRRRHRGRDRHQRRLGLGLRLGRRQQHDQHQQQQQLRQQQQPAEQRQQPQRQQQLAAQRAAARRGPVQGQGHGQQVRRQRARRLGFEPAGRGQPAPVPEHGSRRGEQPFGREREQL